SDARHFIGQRNRDDLERTSCQELCEPRIFFGMLAGTPQDRMRTNNQDATQVAIALFGDRPKLLFAASRILSRYKSNPGRKITARPERLRISNDGRDGARTQNANAGNGRKPLARLARAMQCNDPLLHRSDQGLYSLKLRGHHYQARASIDGQPSILIVRNNRQQTLYPFASLRS